MPRKRTRASDGGRGQRKNPSQNRQQKGIPSNEEPGSRTSEGEMKADLVARSTNGASAVSSEGSTASPTIPSDSEDKGKTSFYGRVYSLSKRGRRYLVTQLGVILPSIILMLLGFKELPKSIPLLTIVKQYPVGSPIVGGILLLVALIALFISFGPEPKEPKASGNAPKQSNDWRSWRWIIATAMSTTSFIVSSSLLAVVLIRPSWCPASLCPQITNPLGVHDANLDMYFLTFQSSAIVIPGDPARASVTDVSNEKSSHTVNAVLLKNHAPSSIYRIVLVVRSLYQGQFNILIDKVALIVYDRPITPRLNVWVRNPNEHFDVSRYGIVYHGEGNGAVLLATYQQSPNGFTQLAANEADQLDVQIKSYIPVDLKFKIQVTYHIATEQKTYSLQLPEIFEVVFSDLSNWHQYQLQGNHFVAVP